MIRATSATTSSEVDTMNRRAAESSTMLGNDINTLGLASQVAMNFSGNIGNDTFDRALSERGIGSWISKQRCFDIIWTASRGEDEADSIESFALAAAENDAQESNGGKSMLHLDAVMLATARWGSKL